jgi:hypothetical protein
MLSLTAMGGMNHDCWLLEYPWQFVLCRYVRCRNTPVLQVLLTASFDKEGMTAVYQQP